MVTKERRKRTRGLVILVGGIAQLGEHLLCKQGVDSSILFVYTIGLAGWQPNGHRYGLIAQVVRAHA